MVLQASGPNALGIVRSLGRAGVPVIACDHDPRALGLLSRYARPALTADPLTAPDRFVEDLAAIGRSLPERGVLFATHDEAIAAIGPREGELAEWFHRPWSPWSAMEGIMDKGASTPRRARWACPCRPRSSRPARTTCAPPRASCASR